MVCISGICNFEKLYPIHNFGYMHDISYLRGDVCQKSGVSSLWKIYIYISRKLVCGCFQFCQFLVGTSWSQYCQFADVSTFANLLECGVNKPLDTMINSKPRVDVRSTEKSQNLKICSILCVCMFSIRQLSSMFHSANETFLIRLYIYELNNSVNMFVSCRGLRSTESIQSV
jgi:hypothetical protein